MKRIFILQPSPHPARRNAAAFCMEAPDGWVVTAQEPGRSADQNAAMWPILDAFAKQLQWSVNGRMEWMTSEEWKDVLSAAFRQETVRLAMAFDGPGVVMLGQRTSKFGKRAFSDWLEFLHAAAASRGVDLGAGVSGH